MQEGLDNVHEQFIEAVAQGRKMPVDLIRQLADGRIFTGQQAKTLGLVDSLGDLEDAITAAKKMAGIKGKPSIVEKRKTKGIFEFFRSQVSSSISGIYPSFKMGYLFAP